MKTQESFYDILGIAKDADTKEIRSAYRRQSKLLHPDVCTIPDGEERFQAVKLAYETLMDEKKRKHYDRRLERGESSWDADTFDTLDRAFAGFYKKAGTGRPPVHGLNFRHTFHYRVADMLMRREALVHLTVNDRCTTCHASGKVPKQGTSTCKVCDGKGFSFVTTRDPALGTFTTTRRCEPCEGTGHTLDEPCPDCAGSRFKSRKITCRFQIPEAATDGTVLRLSGQGGVGLFDGEPGDLLVTLRHDADDPAIVSDTGDVYYHILLPPEAFLSGKAKFERYDGKVVTAVLEARAGCRHTVEGAGVAKTSGGRGDVIYLFYPDLAKGGR